MNTITAKLVIDLECELSDFEQSRFLTMANKRFLKKPETANHRVGRPNVQIRRGVNAVSCVELQNFLKTTTNQLGGRPNEIE